LTRQSLERSGALRMTAAVAGKQNQKDEDHTARQISHRRTLGRRNVNMSALPIKPVHVSHPPSQDSDVPVVASLWP
jgi:hypothetical protein